MSILVAGATGTVGRNVVAQLVKRGANVRALVREPAKANLADGVLPDADRQLGAQATAIGSDVLGRSIAYGGGDPSVFEQKLRKLMPTWMAFDMRLMSERFISDGMLPDAGDVERLTELLGRPLRSYGDFASEVAAAG